MNVLQLSRLDEVEILSNGTHKIRLKPRKSNLTAFAFALITCGLLVAAFLYKVSGWYSWTGWNKAVAFFSFVGIVISWMGWVHEKSKPETWFVSPDYLEVRTSWIHKRIAIQRIYQRGKLLIQRTVDGEGNVGILLWLCSPDGRRLLCDGDENDLEALTGVGRYVSDLTGWPLEITDKNMI